MENIFKKLVPLSRWREPAPDSIRGVRGEVKNPKRKKISDIFFWSFIILLIIPATRSVILGGFTKVRTAIFAPALKVLDGPVLSTSDLNWQLMDLQGKKISLSSMKGELLLVNSWATWCPPCRAEMPSLEKLFLTYGDRVKFLIVSNEDDQVVSEFIAKKKYTFPVYLAKSASPSALSSKSIPATFIINRDGKVIYKKTGAFDWNSAKVKKFLDAQLGQTH